MIKDAAKPDHKVRLTNKQMKQSPFFQKVKNLKRKKMDCDAVTLFKTGQIDLVALENALLQYKEEEAKKSGIQQFVPVISQHKTKQ